MYLHLKAPFATKPEDCWPSTSSAGCDFCEKNTILQSESARQQLKSEVLPKVSEMVSISYSDSLCFDPKF